MPPDHHNGFFRLGTLLRKLGARAVFALALLLGAFSLSAQEPQPSAPAMVLEFDGAVSPASADYITRALDEAAERNLPLVILRMDTPGGLSSSMREIIRAILASPVPVASYVSPSGARAASAGTYIMYASHVAAMAPATNLGAATPVAIGGGGGGGGGDDGDSPMPFQLQADGEAQDAARQNGASGGDTTDAEEAGADAGPDRPEEFTPGTASEAKAINDAVAYIRGLAELRGRNADWAESAVRRAESLSSREAAELGVIDFVAGSFNDLLAQADGMVVEMSDGSEVTLATQGLSLEHVEPDWRTQLLSIITNPNVALILMLVGIYGLIFEFLNPGALVPGTVGGISLIMGLYSLALLPLNWAGVGLILLGLGLIVAEAFAPSFGILGIGGTVALVMGAVILVDTDVEGIAVSEPLIAATAVAGVVVTYIVVYLTAGSFRARIVSGSEELVDAEARVTDWQGDTGHVWLHGERWKARGPRDLAPDDRVRVSKVTGLVVEVKPLERTG
ncbi:membrane-bound serine protease (ClpP class) [Salinihabitans flavidus]|uniref:Membrane-bound serine protease (ClpP class) n=1 Tax=Salinihabitans flavidus TaxID=569882 RepID=A0A1H8NBV1_9RHOB|nr:nodulation protein NfeD [Salinihabitans flavidus]SEO27026.1 membrane-bound serine protease (ClpP class) [Salinihabitans flavidus]